MSGTSNMPLQDLLDYTASEYDNMNLYHFRYLKSQNLLVSQLPVLFVFPLRQLLWLPSPPVSVAFPLGFLGVVPLVPANKICSDLLLAKGNTSHKYCRKTTTKDRKNVNLTKKCKSPTKASLSRPDIKYLYKCNKLIKTVSAVGEKIKTKICTAECLKESLAMFYITSVGKENIKVHVY
jgi:hypothetical protein